MAAAGKSAEAMLLMSDETSFNIVLPVFPVINY
jgi:hypothetical protein